MVVRVLIADDHSIVRQGLRMFLDCDGELEVVGEAQDGIEAVSQARQYRPDIVIMDLLMPRMDGIRATEIIHREMPEVRILVLTTVLEKGSVSEVVRAGASGYLLKDIHAGELRRAIKAAAAGQAQLASEAAANLMADARLPESAANPLTERETEVLQLMVRGMSNKEIARTLVVGEQTVKTHVRHILEKLGVCSRTQAVLYALENQLIRPE
jgi:two-component system, NarL family, response regulator LiaR